jgi:molybdopterin-guanine dinucleotide biosynthesis protein A
MGRDKALLPFRGEPLIQRVARRVQPIASEMLIIADNVQTYKFLGFPVIPDRIAGQGVLGGLYTALWAANQPFVAPVACDVPFISAALLQAEMEILAGEGADVVIPQTADGLEPLHAVYRRAVCLPFVEDALHRQQRRLISWFGQARVRVLTPEELAALDPDGRAFVNINTPEDLAEEEGMEG